MPSARVPVFVVSVVSGTVTVAAWVLWQPEFAFRLPMLRVAFATAIPIIALVAAFPVVDRLLRRPGLAELALACALVMLALSELAFVTIPVLGARTRPDLSVWAALAGSACGAALFAGAAFAPHRRLRHPMLAVAVSGTVTTTTLVLIGVLAVMFGDRLPKVLAAATAPGVSARPDMGAALPALEIIVAAIYGLAAAGFLRRSARSRDEFSGWLAIAAVLAASAYGNFFLHQDSYSQPVSIGDAFLICFFAALIAGSAKEIRSYWRTMPEAAVLEERRRIARDLHDGMAQELAYLSRNLQTLDGTVDKETKASLQRAADRAELEVRQAINTLAAAHRQSVNVAIAQAVGEVAARDHIKLELDVVPGIWLSATRADALVRIACEAVGNAAHHSGAGSVSLTLWRHGSRIRLRVRDNGCGFDPGAPAAGFGLASMHDRASSVGGDLRISSVPGRGTEVEATL
jgi:signal transduction histidine kinase